jgi:hypothetical protein
MTTACLVTLPTAWCSDSCEYWTRPLLAVFLVLSSGGCRSRHIKSQAVRNTKYCPFPLTLISQDDFNLCAPLTVPLTKLSVSTCSTLLFDGPTPTDAFLRLFLIRAYLIWAMASPLGYAVTALGWATGELSLFVNFFIVSDLALVFVSFIAYYTCGHTRVVAGESIYFSLDGFACIQLFIFCTYFVIIDL